MSTLEDRWLAAKLREGEQRKQAMREEARRIAQLGPVKRPALRTETQADHDDARDAADWWLDVETHGRELSIKED